MSCKALIEFQTLVLSVLGARNFGPIQLAGLPQSGHLGAFSSTSLSIVMSDSNFLLNDFLQSVQVYFDL